MFFQYAAQQPAGGSLVTMIIPFVIMIAVFYFLLIRPQKKKQSQRSTMLNALKKGDKIVTIGGLHGTIMELTNDTVVLRVNDVTKLTFDRSAISHAIKESEG
ncbi:preprotein translocase subunit YajC [compost metagenome]|jgi:preprotein translocase subunit YajC|uniref:Preprotein translocase subunit YajC n=1 Tax=Paenibacillus rhizolycopersici TaxID=2780073 RepID=A0ABS2HEM3_9BACL|nr:MULTISPECIES: preprotein translocase subunit YajC [Paenibacillus]MBM6998271.1 preprotein translocase subunit YajC [Paenibacillus rhizolycopersici]MUG89123.1 preprotein translocase subunit YajC [Paenibacillus timonensis]GIP50481.1 preprotein translocase subunit YajC [Paenibacillus sp. J53TS2]